MSDSVQPQRQQPTRLPCPWDSPGKNTGVGCHFLLRCMKVKSESEVAQSCQTLKQPHGLQPTRLLCPWTREVTLICSEESFWCWERLRAGIEEGNRGWDGWMASLTQWTWVWAKSRKWWRTGKLGVLQPMGLQRIRHGLVTEQVSHCSF